MAHAYPCKTKTHSKYKKNIFGMKVITYTSKTRWCYDYFRVLRSPAPSFSTSYRAIGWLKKNETRRSWWGTDDLYYRDFANVEFGVYVPKIGCQEWETTIEKIQNANGTANAW